MGPLFFAVQMTDHGNVFAQKPEKRTLQIRDDRIDLYDVRLQSLFATKRKQLTGESGGAPGGFADFSDMFFGRALYARFRQNQIAITQNRSQKIIEIMRHPAGQLPKRFHFLRVA